MADQQPSFELKRFTWAAPDRLDVAGTFSGLGEAPAGAASLLVTGAAGEHRLSADADSPPPGDDEQWAATFTWQEPPVAFDAARLELDGGLCVELPPPGARRALRRQVFEVHGSDEDAGQDTPAESPIEALHLQAALLTAEEHAREQQAAAQQAGAELARVQQDLAAERASRAADAERFRETLERFRVAADEAVASEQGAAAQLDTDLREAHEALDGLHAELEQSRQEAAQLRSELEDAALQTRAARADHEKASGALDEACAGVERLLEQLKSLRP
jgi:hypothetical protein